MSTPSMRIHGGRDGFGRSRRGTRSRNFPHPNSGGSGTLPPDMSLTARPSHVDQRIAIPPHPSNRVPILEVQLCVFTRRSPLFVSIRSSGVGLGPSWTTSTSISLALPIVTVPDVGRPRHCDRPNQSCDGFRPTDSSLEALVLVEATTRVRKHLRRSVEFPTGDAVCIRFRRGRPHARPGVPVTGRSSSVCMDCAASANMNDRMPKPYSHRTYCRPSLQRARRNDTATALRSTP